MAFASIHIPNFIVQAIVRTELELLPRAVAIVEGAPPLWSVVAANAAAALAGIELGMAKSQAAQFPAVEIRHRSPAQEKSAHAALLDLAWSISPRVESYESDTVVLDLHGLSALLGSEENITKELTQRAPGLGFEVRIAVASIIDVAILASRGLPGITRIAPGKEANSLAALSVRTLLPGAEILDTLARWGVHTCGALAALPVLQLSERLGQEGVRLHALARGATSRSLVLAANSVSFREEMELDESVEDLESLSFLLGRLLDQVCRRLEARALSARSIRMEFMLERSFEKDLQRSASAGEHQLLPSRHETILALPVPMRDSKVLLKLLRLRLQPAPPPAAIVKMILSAEPDRVRHAQGGLFLPATPEPEKLEVTLARLAHLVGDSNVGSPQLLDTHRPDEIRMRRFSVAREEAENRRSKKTVSQKESSEPASANPANGCRIFRPGIPARINLRSGRPAKIYFQGLRGEVVAASGPWRSSGDWWQEKPWEHEEWDVEIEFEASTTSARTPNLSAARGMYLVYFDSLRQNWFLRGMYD